MWPRTARAITFAGAHELYRSGPRQFFASREREASLHRRDRRVGVSGQQPHRNARTGRTRPPHRGHRPETCTHRGREDALVRGRPHPACRRGAGSPRSSPPSVSTPSHTSPFCRRLPTRPPGRTSSRASARCTWRSRPGTPRCGSSCSGRTHGSTARARRTPTFSPRSTLFERPWVSPSSPTRSTRRSRLASSPSGRPARPSPSCGPLRSSGRRCTTR